MSTDAAAETHTMSTDAAAETHTMSTDAAAETHTHDAHAHPSDARYVQVAALLAAITAAEVATYFVDIGPILIPALMVMMVVKFFYVAAWFMHLKFDSVVFTRFFVTGLILATAVYCIALTVFEFWSKG